jgi:hypothetical protein
VCYQARRAPAPAAGCVLLVLCGVPCVGVARGLCPVCLSASCSGEGCALGWISWVVVTRECLRVLQHRGCTQVCVQTWMALATQGAVIQPHTYEQSRREWCRECSLQQSLLPVSPRLTTMQSKAAASCLHRQVRFSFVLSDKHEQVTHMAAETPVNTPARYISTSRHDSATFNGATAHPQAPQWCHQPSSQCVEMVAHTPGPVHARRHPLANSFSLGAYSGTRPLA